MIARAKLEVILGVLAPRFSGAVAEPIHAESDPAPPVSITVERIAVVSVIGTLVSRSGYLDAASGLLSYADIGEAIATAMADPSVRGVILDVDSPGGEVGGLFDLVEQIRAIRSASDKPLWAVANESALSAAYAIASAADRQFVCTGVDGSGAIGILAHCRKKRRSILGSLVLKLGIGVRDAWAQEGAKIIRRLSKRFLKGSLMDQVAISTEFVRIATGHFFRLGCCHRLDYCGFLKL